MSVLIKGIELPEKVQVLELHSDGKVFTRKGYLVGEAVTLPDHHGRLGDLDALCEDLLERWSVAETKKEELIKAVMADVVTPIIACQPTIVEAEGES